MRLELQKEREAWIGMVHVRPLEGCTVLGRDAKGAYGNIAALASSAGDYNELVRSTLQADRLLVLEVSDLHPARVYKAEDRQSDYLNYLVDQLSISFPVQFHTFYNYSNDD
jgi:hypothetical protein